MTLALWGYAAVGLNLDVLPQYPHYQEGMSKYILGACYLVLNCPVLYGINRSPQETSTCSPSSPHLLLFSPLAPLLPIDYHFPPQPLT